MKSKTIIFLLILLARLICSSGQEAFPELDRLVLPSPQAASLGQFGLEETGLYTGTPYIIIPLYTISGKKITLPISLHYQASGIRVDEIAGWTGLGWILSAGGSISRTVVGLPDDHTSGYLYIQNIPIPPATNQMFGSWFWDPPEDQYGKWSLLKNLADNNIDAEPDIYSFHFAGNSGKFYMDRNRQIFVCPRQNIKIIPYFNQDRKIASWEIIDASGNHYYFGTNQNIETTIPLSGNGAMTEGYISAWNLSSIETANNEDSFIFEYTVGSAITTYPLPVKKEEKNDGHSMPADDELHRFSLTSHNISLIKSIVWREGRLDFLTDTLGGYPGGYHVNLSRITLRNPTGSDIKHFVFQYSFFPSVGCGTPQDYLPPCKRIRLDKITEFSGNWSDSKPPWWFFYNGQPLPPRGTFSRDYWGYYNGSVNEYPIPSLRVRNHHDPGKTFPEASYTGRYNIDELTRLNLNLRFVEESEWETRGANMEPDAIKTLAGMLEKIVYPTGASTIFKYEPHDFGYLAGIPKKNTLVAESWPKTGSSLPDTSTRYFQISFPQVVYLQPVFWILKGSEKDLSEPPLPPDALSSVNLDKSTGTGSFEGIYQLSYSDAIALPDEGRSGKSLLLQPGNYRLRAIAYPQDLTMAVISYFPGTPYDKVVPIYENIRHDTIIRLGSERWPDDTSHYVSAILSLNENDDRLAEVYWSFYSTDQHPDNVYKGDLQIPLSYCRITHLSSNSVVLQKYFIDMFPDDSVDFQPPGLWRKSALETKYLEPGEYLLEVCPRIPGECGYLKISYSKFANREYKKKAGGLRVSKIIHLDDAADTIGFKQYRYTMDPEEVPGPASSGVLMGYPRFVDLDEYTLCDVNSSQFDMTVFPVTVYSSVRNILSNTSGSHIGYRRVEEIQPDSGRIVYKFTSAMESPDITPDEFPFPPQASYDWKRGLLVEKQIYDRKDRLTYLEKTCYNSTGNDPLKGYIPGLRAVYRKSGQYFPELRQYFLATGWNHPVEKETINFDMTGDRPFRQHESITFHPGHLQMSASEITNSDGEKTITRYYYPDDMDPTDPVTMVLKNKHMVNALQKKEVFTDSVLIDGEIIGYSFFRDGKLVLPATFEQFESGSYREKLRIEDYDDYGNILQYRTAGGMPVSLNWDQMGIYPVFKAENTSYLSNPANYPDDALVNAYTYSYLLGLSSVTNPNGQTTSFHYDPFGRLVISKDFEDNILQKHSYHYKGYPGDTSRVYDSGTELNYALPPDTAWAVPQLVNYTCPVCLYVNGGRTGKNGNWYWYEEGCGQQQIGTGDSIVAVPGTGTTKYYVRAESVYNFTSCKDISVHALPNAIVPVMDTLYIPYEGTGTGGHQVNLVYSGCEPLHASTSENWLSVTRLASDQIVLSAGPNPEPSARYDVVDLAGGGAAAAISVVQHGPPDPLYLHIDQNPEFIEPGDAFILTARVTGGTSPYHYLWEHRALNQSEWTEIREIYNSDFAEDSLSFTASQTGFYVRCTVWTGGRSSSTIHRVAVVQ